MPTVIPGPGQDPIPSKDEDLVTFASNFASEWVPADFGATLPLALDLSDANSDFASKLVTASNPSTRTVDAVADKNAARATLVTLLRPAIRTAVAAWRGREASAGGNYPLATSAALSNLGIRIPDAPSPINAPVDAPQVSIASIVPDCFKTRINQLVNGQPVSTRAFPYGVVGVELELTAGGSSRTVTQNRVNGVLDMTGYAAGTTVSIRGRYYTRRGLTGPWSMAVSGPVFRSE